MQLGPQSLSRRIRYLLEKKSLSPPPGRSVMPHSCHLGFNREASPSRARRKPVIRFFCHHVGKGKERIMADETTFELASVQFDAEPVAVFRFGYERFELRARLGPGNLEHAIASAAEVAASVFAKWSHEALAFAQLVRAGEDGGPVRH